MQSNKAIYLLSRLKLYHSIHARGERVEDVIKDMEANKECLISNGSSLAGEATNTEANGAVVEDLEDGELEEEPDNTEPVHSKDSREGIQVSDLPAG